MDETQNSQTGQQQNNVQNTQGQETAQNTQTSGVPGAQSTGDQGIANTARSLINPDSGQQEQTQQPEQPIEYTAFLDDAGNPLLEEADNAKFVEFAKGQRLTQEQAKAAIEYGVAVLADAEENNRLAVIKKLQEWEQESRADNELKEHIDPSSGAVTGLGNLVHRVMGNEDDTKALISVFSDTGIDVNPWMLKFLLRTSKLVKESPFIEGSKAGTVKPMSMVEQAKILYS